MTLDTRWEDVDELLDRSSRTQDEALVHAVAEIVAARFQFPTAEFASYRTHTNIPEETMTVQVGEERVVPDIVVVERINTSDTRLVMTAVVTIPETVNDAEAKRSWARIASIPDQVFYLYVPVGYGVKAKNICHRLKIRYEGVRTWRNTPRGFEINDVSEPMNPYRALMPGFVRRALAAP